MHISWLSVLVHVVGARLRGPLRVALLAAAWILHGAFPSSDTLLTGDAGAPLRHAVVEVDVTQHRGTLTVEVVDVVEVVEVRVVGSVARSMMENIAALAECVVGGARPL